MKITQFIGYSLPLLEIAILTLTKDDVFFLIQNVQKNNKRFPNVFPDSRLHSILNSHTEASKLPLRWQIFPFLWLFYWFSLRGHVLSYGNEPRQWGKKKVSLIGYSQTLSLSLKICALVFTFDYVWTYNSCSKFVHWNGLNYGRLYTCFKNLVLQRQSLQVGILHWSSSTQCHKTINFEHSFFLTKSKPCTYFQMLTTLFFLFCNRVSKNSARKWNSHKIYETLRRFWSWSDSTERC